MSNITSGKESRNNGVKMSKLFTLLQPLYFLAFLNYFRNNQDEFK